MGIKNLLTEEKEKRDQQRTTSASLHRRMQAAVERIRLSVESEMEFLTQLDLQGDYGRPVPIRPEHLTVPSKESLSFMLGSKISPTWVKVAAVRADNEETELHVFIDCRYPYKPSKPEKFPLEATEAAANTFMRHILDCCTTQSVDRAMESCRVVRGQEGPRSNGPGDFYNAKSKVIKELMTNHPEACRLFGVALALTEAEKRHHEYQAGQYHDFDEKSPQSVPPFSLQDLANTFNNLCERASVNDSVEVKFDEHHAFRTAYGFLHSLQLEDFSQLMPRGDKELEGIVKCYAGDDLELDEYEGPFPR